MISTLLSHAQKLFGRAFLVAGFIPSALFLLTNVWIWGDPKALEALLHEVRGDLKNASVSVLLAIVAVYLLAYVVYGVRAGLHEIYHGGQFPERLQSLLLQGSKRQARRRWDRLSKAAAGLDDARWPTTYDFDKTFVARPPSKNVVTSMLVRAENELAAILSRLKAPDEVDEEALSSLLHDARRVVAWADHLEPQEKCRSEKLVEAIRKAYTDCPPMERSRSAMESERLREWTDAYLRLNEDYPDDQRWLRPTRLGNLLSVLELYPLQRYGIDLSTLWPRLSHVVDEPAWKRIDEATIFFDFTIIMSFLSLATVVSGASGIAYSGATEPVTWLLKLGLPLLAALLFYRLALRAARNWSLQMQAAVDLFRLKLLDALNVRRPQTPAEERGIWDELRRFFTQSELPEEHVRFCSGGEE